MTLLRSWLVSLVVLATCMVGTPGEPPSAAIQTLLAARRAQVAAQNADPAQILGSKLVAWFDDTDTTRMFSDASGTVPITEGGSVAVQKARNNASLTRTRTTSSSGPVWSATAYNQGKAPGLVANGTSTRMQSNMLFPVNAATRASFVVAFQYNAVSGDPTGSLWTAQDDNYTKISQYYYDDAILDEPSVVLYPLHSIPGQIGARLYFEYDATTLRVYVATGTGKPVLTATYSDAPPTAGTFPYGFSYFNLAGSQFAKGVEQQFLWLNAPPTDDERERLDAALVQRARDGPVDLVLDATPDTVGSMSANSTTLTVLDATGYDVGKTVIVNASGSGTDPIADQWGMTGPGGIWPAASAANETAVLALTSSPASNAYGFPYIRAADTGVVYMGKYWDQSGYQKIPGYAKYDGSNPGAVVGNWDPYTWRAYPLPLVAKIVAKSGNTLTLDTPSVGAVTNGLVTIDNYPAIKNAIRGGDGLNVRIGAGSFWMSGDIRMTLPKIGWNIEGSVDELNIPTTILKKPRWARNWFFTFSQTVWPTVKNLHLIGNHLGKYGAGLPVNGSHVDLNPFGVGVMLLDSKNPLILNSIAEDIPQGAFQIASPATADTGRPYITGAQPFETEDGRRLAGLIKDVKVYANYPHQSYIQWGLGGNALSARVEVRDMYFWAKRLTKTIEFFNTVGAIFTRPVIRDGDMSSNSNTKHEIVDLDIIWSAKTRTLAGEPEAGPIFQQIADDGFMLNINNNAYPTDGDGSFVKIKQMIAEGPIDATGKTLPMIASYGVPGWTIYGDYDPTVPDDGLRKGLILGPMSQGNVADFLTGGGRLDINAPTNSTTSGRFTMRNLRAVPALGYPGGGSYPAGYGFSLTYDATGGGGIQDTISGTSAARVQTSRTTGATGTMTNTGNISNDAYNALGATGLVNALVLAKVPQFGVDDIRFIRGKRVGSTITLSGANGGLTVVDSGKGFHVTGAPTQHGALYATETLAGTSNSGRVSLIATIP